MSKVVGDMNARESYDGLLVTHDCLEIMAECSHSHVAEIVENVRKEFPERVACMPDGSLVCDGAEALRQIWCLVELVRRKASDEAARFDYKLQHTQEHLLRPHPLLHGHTYLLFSWIRYSDDEDRDSMIYVSPSSLAADRLAVEIRFWNRVPLPALNEALDWIRDELNRYPGANSRLGGAVRLIASETRFTSKSMTLVADITYMTPHALLWFVYRALGVSRYQLVKEVRVH